jgi:hypothetical protein
MIFVMRNKGVVFVVGVLSHCPCSVYSVYFQPNGCMFKDMGNKENILWAN